MVNNTSSHQHGVCQEHEVSSKACLSSNGDANHCHGDDIIQGDIMSEMVPSFDDNAVCCPIAHEPFHDKIKRNQGESKLESSSA